VLASPGGSIDFSLCREIRFEGNTQTQTKVYATSGLASLSGSHCPTDFCPTNFSLSLSVEVVNSEGRDKLKFVGHQEESR